MILLVGCTPPPAATVAVQASLDDTIATLVHVTWDPPVEGTVEHDRGTVEGVGEATIFGYASDTTLDLRVVTVDATSEWQAITTGPLPEGAPPITVNQPGSFGAEWMAVSWQQFPAASTGTYVIDADGAIVWYWLPDWGITPSAHLVDGSLLLTHTRHDVIEDATYAWYTLDGRLTEAPLPYHHHEAIPIPGGIAAIVGEVRTIDGEDVVGDTIVEIVDGVSTVIWSAFDVFPVEHHEAWDAGTYTAGVDWNHTNGIFYDDEDDAYYVSSFYLRCVAKVDRTSGVTEWVLGGDYSTLTFPNDPGPSRQHAPEWVDGELMFFDNGYGDDAGSRLVRWSIDVEAGTATRTWEYRHPEGLFTFVFGDVDARPDGGHLSSWGNYSDILATDADDVVTWRAELPEGYLVAQVEAFDL